MTEAIPLSNGAWPEAWPCYRPAPCWSTTWPAGILIAATGPAWVIAAHAASYAVSAAALARLRLPALPRPAGPSLRRELAGGRAEFAARPWLWSVTVQFALFKLFTWGPDLVLGPVLGLATLGFALPPPALALRLPLAAVTAAALLAGAGSAAGGPGPRPSSGSGSTPGHCPRWGRSTWSARTRWDRWRSSRPAW